MSFYVTPYSVIFLRLVPPALIAVFALAAATFVVRALKEVVMTSPMLNRVASSLLTTIALGLAIFFVFVVSVLVLTPAEAKPVKTQQKTQRVVRDVTPLFAAADTQQFSARRHRNARKHYAARRHRAAAVRHIVDLRAMTPIERSDYYRRGGSAVDAYAPPARRSRAAKTAEIGTSAGIGVGSYGLVATARSYIGTNPTGRSSLWCGAFMDLVLRKNGYRGGGNLASAYARYGVRIAGPQVGAIAVMGRRGGGHVGVVSGIDANGNPIIISGNTRVGPGPHTTLEHAYPRSRIYAYVLPR